MKMSNRTKLYAAIIAAFVVFVLLIVLLLNVTNLKPHTNIAFYRIPERQVEAFQKTFEGMNSGKKKQYLFRFYTLDGTKPLVKQIKSKYDLVITPKGFSSEELIAKLSKKANKLAYPQDILEKTTISVKQTAVYAGKKNNVMLLPLVFDNNELAVDRRIFKESKIKEIKNWDDVDTIARTAKKNSTLSVVFAGADDSQFLSVAGALVESLDGRNAYDALVSKIKNEIYKNEKNAQPLTAGKFDSMIENLCAPGQPLYNTAQKIAEWQNKSYLYTDPFALSKTDVQNLMKMENAAIVLMTLSDHRATDFKTIENYNSTYYPSQAKASSRTFASPVYCALPLSTKKIARKTISLLAINLQDKLSSNTGLAPVSAACQTPDRQADDVRYWISSTNAPAVPLSEAAFKDDKNRNLFASALRNYIKYNLGSAN